LSAVLEEGFIIRESVFDTCLELWPRKEFERETGEIINKLNPYNPKDRLIIRKLSEGNPVELDANDRILRVEFIDDFAGFTLKFFSRPKLQTRIENAFANNKTLFKNCGQQLFMCRRKLETPVGVHFAVFFAD
jgi:hypothetical protein